MRLKSSKILILIGAFVILGFVLTGCLPSPDPIDELEDNIIDNRPEEVEKIVEESKKGWENEDYREILDISDWIKAETDFIPTGTFDWVYEYTDYDYFKIMSELELSRALLTVINQEIETEYNEENVLLKNYIFSKMTEEAHAYAGFYPEYKVDPIFYDEGFSRAANFLEQIPKEMAKTVTTEIAPYLLPPGINVVAVGIIKVYGVYSKYNQAHELEQAMRAENYSKALNFYFRDKVVWDGVISYRDWKGPYRIALGINPDHENYDELIEEKDNYFEELFEKYKPYARDGWKDIDGVSIDRGQIRRETAKLIVHKLEEEFIDD